MHNAKANSRAVRSRRRWASERASEHVLSTWGESRWLARRASGRPPVRPPVRADLLPELLFRRASISAAVARERAFRQVRLTNVNVRGQVRVGECASSWMCDIVSRLPSRSRRGASHRRVHFRQRGRYESETSCRTATRVITDAALGVSIATFGSSPRSRKGKFTVASSYVRRMWFGFLLLYPGICRKRIKDCDYDEFNEFDVRNIMGSTNFLFYSMRGVMRRASGAVEWYLNGSFNCFMRTR